MFMCVFVIISLITRSHFSSCLCICRVIEAFPEDELNDSALLEVWSTPPESPGMSGCWMGLEFIRFSTEPSNIKTC